MSLNGLDASAVNEAHQLALVESGGWFLLNYVNRDTVEVLGRGTGGVTEAKVALEQYEEKSPLYGLVQYRRKRVILKYVPEGTSRLLQVRLAVQFQSVLDAFPHDTVFSFTAPSELVDSALGLSTMLQPSVHSGTLTPSNASGRHHRLNEIREDGEEGISSAQVETMTIPPTKSLGESTLRSPASSDLVGLPASAVRAKALLAKRKEADRLAAAEMAAEHAAVLVSEGSDSTIVPPATAITPDQSVSTTPHQNHPSTRRGLSKLREEIASPPSPAHTQVPRSPDQVNSRVPHTRHLSENETDSISQWNEQVAAYAGSSYPKVKKKLAPRPHVESTARPKTPNSVANLPPTVRASNRSNVNVSDRPSSRQSSKSVPSRFVTATDAPPLPTPSRMPLYKSAESRRVPSVASSVLTDASSAAPKKLRLMKALQLRKRNLLLAQRTASAQSDRTQMSYGPDFHVRNISEISSQPFERPMTPKIVNDRVARVSAENKHEKNTMTASPTSATTASMGQSTKPSSFSGDVNGKTSPASFSMDTHASSTPRAIPTSRQNLTVLPTHDDTDESDSDADFEFGATKATVSPTDEAFMRLTGTTTPPIPQTIVEQPTPRADLEPEVQQPKVEQKREIMQEPRRELKPDSKRETKRASKRESKRLSKRQKSYVAGLNPAELAPSNKAKSDASFGSRRRSRRRDGPGSPRIPGDSDISDGSDDDSFMEELRNATVQEAKPVSVARTPMPPTVRKLSSDRIRDLTRAPTVETRKSIKSNASESHSMSVRSTSATMPQWPPVGSDGNPVLPLSKKPTLSSGISKRIKALEVLTHRESISSAPPSPREAPANRSSITNLLHRASFISHGQTPNASTEKSPPKKLPPLKPVPITAGMSESGPRPLVQRQGETAEIFLPQQKGETISVTARIVRPHHRSNTGTSQIYHELPAVMHRSPLIVEHDRSESIGFHSIASNGRSNASIDRPRSPASERRHFSFSSHKSGSAAKPPHTDGRISRLSIMNRGSKNSKANSETSSITEEKRTSRASRIMKRMTGLGSRLGHSSRSGFHAEDGVASDTIMEQSESTPRRESMVESVLEVINIGNVNVQFPESLLWKRRYMRIDDQGFLIFSPPTDNTHVRMTNRKFHLSDIKAPSLPSQEREEMAWSIRLDLEDGSCIQCACESEKAQRQIMKMLLDAHNAYNSLYTY